MLRGSTPVADLVWATLVSKLDSEDMKLDLNSATDTLPHNSNLVRWYRGTLSAASKLCGQKQKLLHILNNCDVALKLHRYNRWHDQVAGLNHTEWFFSLLSLLVFPWLFGVALCWIYCFSSVLLPFCPPIYVGTNSAGSITVIATYQCHVSPPVWCFSRTSSITGHTLVTLLCTSIWGSVEHARFTLPYPMRSQLIKILPNSLLYMYLLITISLSLTVP